MKKAILLLVALALIAPLAIRERRTARGKKPLKIAFFVSDLGNVFHQAQFAEAKKYAKEKYGADVYAFDGKSDSATMTQNIDQVVAQGMDAATLHIWDAEAAKPGHPGRPQEGHHHDLVLQPAGRHGHPDGPQRRSRSVFRHGRRDGQAVEGRIPQQAHRHGAARMAQPHRK